jgi:hypothetical protein
MVGDRKGEVDDVAAVSSRIRIVCFDDVTK